MWTNFISTVLAKINFSYLFNFGMVEKELSRAGMFSMSFNDLVMDRLVSNMVHVYALIKRLVRDIFRVRKAINLQTEKTRGDGDIPDTVSDFTAADIFLCRPKEVPDNPGGVDLPRDLADGRGLHNCCSQHRARPAGTVLGLDNHQCCKPSLLTLKAYQLDPYEMSLGRIGERQTNAFLGVEEVYGVAEARIERKERGPIGEPEYATAIEWIEAALK